MFDTIFLNPFEMQKILTSHLRSTQNFIKKNVLGQAKKIWQFLYVISQPQYNRQQIYTQVKWNLQNTKTYSCRFLKITKNNLKTPKTVEFEWLKIKTAFMKLKTQIGD